MRIALLQCKPGRPNLAAGLERLDAAAENAATRGAQVLVVPEMFLTGYAIGPGEVGRLAQPVDGAAFRTAGDIARRHGLAIVYGYPERGAEGAVYNAVQFVGADGGRLANYRKTHLFGDVDRRQFRAGGALSVPVVLDGLRIAIAVCYDIEFPEVARSLAVAGADVLLVPTANMRPFESVATRLVPARAEENTLFVAYANYVGQEAEFTYCGLSCIVAPDGEDLARAPAEEEALIVADLDPIRLQAARLRATYLHDRHPELYSGVGPTRPPRRDE